MTQYQVFIYLHGKILGTHFLTRLPLKGECIRYANKTHKVHQITTIIDGAEEKYEITLIHSSL